VNEVQQSALTASLGSLVVKSALSKLNVSVTDADVRQAMGYAHVLELRSRSYQIEPHEKSFAEKICSHEQDDALLLGNTKAIEGFLLRKQSLIQLKRAGIGSESPPGAFVQAFLTAWQKAHGFRGISLYISAPGITVDFALRRWNTAGTDPKLEQRHLNGQIGRVSVYCSDGITDLPLQLAKGR
jgi:hypothetical protein